MDGSDTVDIRQYAGMMLSHMPVGVALYDAQDFRLIRANPYFQRILDAHPDPRWQNGQTIGHPFSEWIPSSILDKFLSVFHHVATTGIPYRAGEHTFINPSGGSSHLTWNLDALRDKDGNIIYLLLHVSNVTKHVTARQRAEAAQATLSATNRVLEADRKRLTIIEMIARKARESLDLGQIGVAAVDAIMTHFNPRSLYIHVADPEEHCLRLLQYSLASNISNTQEVLDRARVVSYESPLMTARASRQREPTIIEDTATLIQAGNLAENHPLISERVSGYICVPLWYHERLEGTLTATFYRPIQADGAEVQTLLGCATHIVTALAHARLQTEVENERARLRTALDQLPEGILIIATPDNTISYANQASAYLLGKPLENLVGGSFIARIDDQPYLQVQKLPKRSLSWLRLTARALRGETVSSEEVMVERPDGSKVTCLCSCAPLRNEHGRINAAMIVFQDITHLKSAEQQKNEFLSIASHELRTPITVMLGFAEILQILLQQDGDVGEVSQRALKHITEQSEQLTRLIEEMLDVTRIENARLELHSEWHNLVGTLTNVIESQSVISKKRSIHFVTRDIQDHTTLLAWYDEKRLIQVFNNLLSNATKYSSDTSEIEIGLQHVHEQPASFVIWVRDQGIGIPVAELPHIFERFYRAGNLDHSISGLGIGLYLVKELVVLHGGQIWAESQEGKGSTFYIRLPFNGEVE